MEVKEHNTSSQSRSTDGVRGLVDLSVWRVNCVMRVIETRHARPHQAPGYLSYYNMKSFPHPGLVTKSPQPSTQERHPARIEYNSMSLRGHLILRRYQEVESTPYSPGQR